MSSDQPFVNDEDLPYPHHPVLQLPRLHVLAENEVFRHDEGQHVRLAEWCDGRAEYRTDLGMCVVAPGEVVIPVGAYAVRTWDEDNRLAYLALDEADYRHDWWPKGYTPGWRWRCYQWYDPRDEGEPTPPVELEFPAVHHPIEYLPWPDPDTTVLAFQNRPLTVERLVEWCGGEFVPATGAIRLDIDGEPVDVPLGDWVLSDGERFWTFPAAQGFNLYYWPAGRDPGFTFTCERREDA